MRDNLQKVYVIMGDDYPCAVTSTEELADKLIEKFKRQMPERYGPHANIYYRHYEMLLDGEEEYL